MASLLQFDHAVILVKDLSEAIADYQKLGFNPFFGGQHAGGKTHNALIVFEDSSYLELLAPTSLEFLQQIDPDDYTSFLYMFAYGEGLGGYALQSSNLQSQIEMMERQGLNVKKRPPGGRARPDRQELRWQSAIIGNSMTPFFIQDDTPRVLRVPNDKDKTAQPNRVHGVAGITVAVSDLKTGVARYRSITGSEPQSQDASQGVFSLGNFTIRVVADHSNADKGDQLLALHLSGTQSGVLNHKLTHSATIELIAK